MSGDFAVKRKKIVKNDSFWLFYKAVINRRSEADGGEEGLGGLFEASKGFGAEEFLEFGAAKIGDGEDFVDFEAGVFEDGFDVFRVVVVEAVAAEVFEVGGFEAEGVDVGPFGPVAEHFREGLFVGDFDDGDATGLKDAVEFVGDFLHVLEMVRGANHHEGVEAVVWEGEGIDVAGFSLKAVAVDFAGLSELGFRIVEKRGGVGARQIFVGEATVATGDIDKSVDVLRQ